MSQHKEIEKYLQDILISIEDAKTFTKDIKRFADFTADKKTYRAVERCIEIIAEAISRVRKIDDKIEIANAQRIVGMRNRVIHTYDNVNEELIWGVVVKHLDELKNEVEELIKTF
ncbi:MAG: DUF86 domain-containing protein [Bacteroidia bacterium]|nr:DUF86 domain-containing protein [Bacteroidia bacterium]